MAPLLEMFGKWDDFLSIGLSDEEVEKFRCHERTGRPLGADSFIARLGNVLGRILHKQKPGTKGSQKKNRNLKIKYGVPGILPPVKDVVANNGFSGGSYRFCRRVTRISLRL